MAPAGFLVALAALSIWIVRQLILAYFSPLSAVPSAHFTAPVSNLWIMVMRYRGLESRRRHEAHQQLGPVIRLGPKELGVSCIEDGVKTIYGGNLDKASRSATLRNYGRVQRSIERHRTSSWETFRLPFMFSMENSKKHAQRRRMYSHVYSRTTIASSRQLRTASTRIVSEQLSLRLESWSKGNGAIEVLNQTRAFGGDFVSAYIFGTDGATSLFQDPDCRTDMINYFSAYFGGFYWLTELPMVTVWLRRCGIHLVPQSTFDAQEQLENMCMDLCRSAEKSYRPEEEAITVYAQLQTNLASSGMSGELLEKTVAAELLDHTLAAVHGIGLTLTYAMFQLSQNASIQTKLRSELIDADQKQMSSPQPIAKQDLPLLRAVLRETMRAHPASPGPTFRVTPTKHTHLGPYLNIPPDTTVSACAYTLHKGPPFPYPEEWRPERWLESNEHELKEMNRWFWAFGSGARGCIGDSLSLYGECHRSATVLRYIKQLTTSSNGALPYRCVPEIWDIYSQNKQYGADWWTLWVT